LADDGLDSELVQSSVNKRGLDRVGGVPGHLFEVGEDQDLLSGQGKLLRERRAHEIAFGIDDHDPLASATGPRPAHCLDGLSFA
jgi:hypothetical protein